MRKLMVLMNMLILAFLVQSCSEIQVSEAKKEDRLVRSMVVGYNQNHEEYSYFGKLAESRKVNISFRTGGELEKLNATEGELIKEGSLIAQIDSRDHRLALNAAKVQYEQAKGEYERYQKLYDKGKLPENTLDKLKSGYLLAKSNYENAQNAVNDCRLLAPFTGYVFEVFVENHEAVGPGQPIISLLDMSKVEVIFEVPEAHLAFFDKNPKFEIEVKHAKLPHISAELKSISEKADPNNLYEVRLQVKNQNNTLKSGMSTTVNLSFDRELADAFIVIPAEAVFHETGKSFVWIINKNNTLKKQEVICGKALNDGKLLLESGLNNGTRILTAGTHFVTEGQKVRLSN